MKSKHQLHNTGSYKMQYRLKIIFHRNDIANTNTITHDAREDGKTVINLFYKASIFTGKWKNNNSCGDDHMDCDKQKTIKSQNGNKLYLISEDTN